MGGGLLQLVAYGAQDAYISANPQITFWKGLYKRHTNFAMEPFRVNFNGQANWGTKHSAVISRHADLLYSTYLEVQLPGNSTETPAALMKWNNDQGRLGYNLIKYVELEIGGQLIDRLYGEWLFLWDSLTSNVSTSTKLWHMVGGGLAAGASTFPNQTLCNVGSGKPSLPNTLYIPLYFFYTKNPGAALPLIALQYHEVKINVMWNDTQHISGDFRTGVSQGLTYLPNPSQASIYIDYIYLDVEERRRMAQQSHEYLIEQSQFNEDKGVSSYNNRIDLTFNHPVKELVWVVQPTSYNNCKLPQGSSTRLKPFTYDQNIVYEQWLQINGQDRMDRRYGDYFTDVQLYQHHTGIGGTVASTSALPTTQPGIYMYSFALKPEEHQPSGTCNFSRIDTATIVMNLSGAYTVDESNDSTYDVRVYATNYNILRIMSGMAGLAYSN
jgi:hypothetical protein